jgi:hypothetical protein
LRSCFAAETTTPGNSQAKTKTPNNPKNPTAKPINGGSGGLLGGPEKKMGPTVPMRKMTHERNRQMSGESLLPLIDASRTLTNSFFNFS